VASKLGPIRETKNLMGSLDGAEVCVLVGLYLLSQLSDINLDIRLYRDDSLSVTNSRPDKQN
jgi:hypothetical protein